MDVEVIDIEENMNRHVVPDDGYDEFEGDETNPVRDSTAQNEESIDEPHVGLEFISEDAAKLFYDLYAKQIGFTACVSQRNLAKLDGNVKVCDFSCDGDGMKRCSGDSCSAMLRIALKAPDKWVVTKFVKEHSHSTTRPNKVHSLRSRRHFAGSAKTVAESYPVIGVIPSGIMYASVDGNGGRTETSCGASGVHPVESSCAGKNLVSAGYATRPCTLKRTLGRDAQNLLDYLKKMQAENPGFYYAIQLDADNRMTNVFWSDARSKVAYTQFGDALILDTMSRVNQYRVPFVPFTGINHHGQKILFGCALLLDESEASFLWLFKTFLTAMSDQAPVSIITDSDKAIQVAVAQAFPEARHCISKWHMLRQGQERLANVCLAHPLFQVDLCNCVNLTDTIEEFESAWDLMLDKYDLRSNDWLQSLYNARRQWVPAYFRDAFFGSISPNWGFETSFFDGYVDQQTTLPLFFRQYERAMEKSFEKEIEADFDTICTNPVLRTPSPMEKQAANLYTRKIFSKFQEELIETFVYTANKIDGDGIMSTYRVAKFEDDKKAYIVSLNITEMQASCSCRMFENAGILCRHILTVFTVTNVLTLPSHYILKRWTRNAKSGFALEQHAETDGQGSLVSRYNNLCREATKFAEEGAIAAETYIVAMLALREGSKKLATLKKNIAKVKPRRSQISPVGHDDRSTSASVQEMTPLLWPRQDEVPLQFILDNGGANQPVADLNLPRLAPVSLHHDDGHPSSMVILPCLKSMTWLMENKSSSPANRVAVINLKLQDYSRTPAIESDVKFQLSMLTLEPMLRSMATINEQLSTPASRVAVINLKLQDTEATSGESDVRFQVSRDTLGAMLRSMAYIREQLLNTVESQSETQSKRARKQQTDGS